MLVASNVFNKDVHLTLLMFRAASGLALANQGIIVGRVLANPITEVVTGFFVTYFEIESMTTRGQTKVEAQTVPFEVCLFSLLIFDYMLIFLLAVDLGARNPPAAN